MPRKKKPEEPHKELKFNGKYRDFKDFFDINKETIYKSIVDIFLSFKECETEENLILRISAKIKGLDWDTKFDFKRNESIVLVRDIMPYFEEVEDYETCFKIYKLHQELTTI